MTCIQAPYKMVTGSLQNFVYWAFYKTSITAKTVPEKFATAKSLRKSPNKADHIKPLLNQDKKQFPCSKTAIQVFKYYSGFKGKNEHALVK